MRRPSSRSARRGAAVAALAVTTALVVGSIAPAATAPSGSTLPSHPVYALTAGPDGNVWFSEAGFGLGRITPSGDITELAGLPAGAWIAGITAGPDGNVWFSDEGPTQAVGKVTPDGTITEYPIPSTALYPDGIVTGPDGNLWVHEQNGILRVTPTGTITEYPVQDNGGSGTITAAGGSLWFTQPFHQIGRITTQGAVTLFPLPNGVVPDSMTTGPDGNAWFVDVGQFTEPVAFRVDVNTGAATRLVIADPSLLPTHLSRIVTGADRNLWFSQGPLVGKFTGDGTWLATYSPPRLQSYDALALGPDGNVWFSAGDFRTTPAIGSVTPSGSITVFEATGPPTVTDEAVLRADAPAATVTATITPNGSATQYTLYWGPAGAAFTRVAGPFPVAPSSIVTTPTRVSAQLLGLQPGTSYHWMIQAENALGASGGADLPLDTPTALPDTVIGFDDLHPGDVIGAQYAAQGVTFADAAVVIATPLAPSQPNAAQITNSCNAELRVSKLAGTFSTTHHHLAITVGDLDPDPVPVTLTGLDLAGAPILNVFTIVSAAGSGVATPIAIDDPYVRIAGFRLDTPATSGCLAVDGVTFDTPAAPPTPDFALGASSTLTTVVAGASASFAIGVHRTGGSGGPVTLSFPDLPPGVTAIADPNPVDGNAATGTTTVTLTAAPGAPAFNALAITVVGTPADIGVGPAPRSVKVPIAVTGSSDLRLQGIELTQGVQTGGFLVPSGDSVNTDYAGTTLVAHMPTFARVYADVTGAPPGGVSAVSIVLRATRNGVPLAGSPLTATFDHPLDIASPCRCVIPTERVAAANVLTFALPDAWTTGTIALEATVMAPPPVFGGVSFVECRAASCAANNDAVLTTIPFADLPAVDVYTLQMVVTGDPIMPGPEAVFAAVRATVPGANRWVIHPYNGLINLNDVKAKADFLGTDGNAAAEAELFYWDIANPVTTDMIAGVDWTYRGGASYSIEDEPAGGPASGTFHHPYAMVNYTRPLTSVAHEVGHMLGRLHASAGCSATVSEPWPPDEQGQMDGIGLDPRTSPPTLLFGGLPGEPATWYDKMSYCANANETLAGGNVPDTWTSARGWNTEADALARFGDRLRQHPRRKAARSTAPASRLVVLAIQPLGGTARIYAVIPSAAPPPGDPSSGYTLVARDAHGVELASAPASISTMISHVGTPVRMFAASLPRLTAIASVSLVDLSGTLLTEPASANVPPHAVVLREPKATTRIRPGAPVRVSWRSALTGPLRIASIDLSLDGGARWHTIWAGPDAGSAVVPASLLARTGRARLRVTVRSGFAEASATSALLTLPGTPPQVAIETPHAVAATSAMAVTLRATAFDDRGAAIVGPALTWTLDGVPVAHGATIDLRYLAPGARRITVTARDRAGRRSRASITLRVRAVPTPFLRIIAPIRVSRRARKVSIVVSTSVPATIRIGRTIYVVGRKPRALRVSITPGPAPLSILVLVSISGETWPAYLTIKR